MTMQTVKKYWYIPLLILVGLGIYVGFKNGFSNLLSSFGFGKNSTTKAEEELNKLTFDQSKVTLSQTDAILISQQLLAAMDQWGTDGKVIIRLLKDRSRDDLLFIIKTFGIKPYNGLGLSQWVDKYLYSVDLNLQGWLLAELSGSDLQAVSLIFKQNNISF